MIERFACTGTLLKPGKISVHNLLIHSPREYERNIDIDSCGDERFDGRHPLRSGRHFDHDVLATEAIPQAFGFVDGGVRIMCEMRRDLQTNVAVHPIRLLVNGPEQIGGTLNILNGNFLVDFINALALASKLIQSLVVIRAATNRFFEDGRIGRDPLQVVLFDLSLKIARHKHSPANVVIPNTLAELL